MTVALTLVEHNRDRLIYWRSLARMLLIRALETTKGDRMTTQKSIRRKCYRIGTSEMIGTDLYQTYVRLSKFAFNSSLKDWISSKISSSVHLREHKLLTKGSSCATSIEGRFCDGAFATRF